MIPHKSLTTLEFNRFLEIIAQYAKSDASRKAILEIAPLSEKEEIEKRFSLIEEVLMMSRNSNQFVIPVFVDIRPLLEKVRPKDAVLEPLELVGIMDFLQAIQEAAVQIRKDASLISLNELVADISDRREFLRILNNAVDREGNILDSASLQLSELRSEKRRLEAKIRKRLEEVIRDEKTSLFLQDDFITQRSGRWVIPVRMDSKGQVPGVVHDVSRTGETAFIEPIGIISLSNEYENIIAEEKAEVMRILRELGSRIREHAHEMEGEFRVLVYLDMLKSIARVSHELQMEIPEINDRNLLHLANARHPLLLHSAMQKGKGHEIIPIDVHMGKDMTVMVITGPNAGGKTVTIKTVGLLSAMALSGIPVTAGASSAIPFFQNLLVDIGDRQSIADNLSTFTAHLANMMEFLDKADSTTLVLIDELGTGTDPEEGAVLACTILKELRGKGALILATTHLTDIKIFAHKEDKMVNASMEFDQETFMPLYRLRTGEPGQSFALETARRYGLPQGIIESARGMLGRRRADLEHLIHDLEQKRRYYEEASEGVKRQSEELREREERVEESIRGAEARKREILANAYKEASEIVIDIKRQMHGLFEEIKKRDKGRARELIKEAVSAHDGVVEKIKDYEEVDAERLTMDELKEGDVVFIKSLGYDAIVVKLYEKKGRLRVKAGSFEMEAPLSDIMAKKGKDTGKGMSRVKISMPEGEAESRINLIGMRVGDAIPRIEKFLNDATLAGLGEVVIIHGIGTGALAKGVREQLSDHPLVKGFRPGEQAEGGGGVTVVSLK